MPNNLSLTQAQGAKPKLGLRMDSYKTYNNNNNKFQSY